MILKQIDFLSPQITLYHKGFLSHSTIISGIISIISLVIIISFGVYYSLDLIKRENPRACFLNRFVEDNTKYSMNYSSIFHYISLSESKDNREFDFQAFRLVGFETYYTDYMENKNIKNFDHWLYSLCKIENDKEGIKKIVNINYLETSLCISKYYNSKDKLYYDINDLNFRWPSIQQIKTNLNVNSYNIILEKCEDETLELILGKGSKCKNDSEIEKYFSGKWGILLYFIDHYIDILDYKEPNQKYFYSIENTLNKERYSINHINFNPSSIITNNGIIFDHNKEELSYIFDRNDVFTERNNENNIYMIYVFWMKNRMQCYKRIYKKIQDVISDIGGISQFITIFATYINLFYNNYKILSDSEKLIYPSINQNIKMPNLSKNYQNYETNKSNNTEVGKIVNSKNELNENQKVLKSNTNLNNYAYIKEKGYKDDSKIINHNENEYSQIKNEKINFLGYFKYKITCNKNNNYIKLLEIFRKKIISEEHLIKNHLNVHSLLKINEINGFDNITNFQLKELIKTC